METLNQTNDLKSRQEAKRIIRQIGIKVTDQRLAILNEIIYGSEHITAQEVYEKVKLKASDIGFATVYRFLRTLTNHNVLSETRVQGLPARYEWADKNHHDHITCTECKKISEFENDEIESLQAEIAASLGYKLTDHILELYGVCTECQKKNNDLPSSIKSKAQLN